MSQQTEQATTERNGQGMGVPEARWVAELALSPNGMHEIRAGAVNARERPLIGYATTYAVACEITDAHNRRTEAR